MRLSFSSKHQKCAFLLRGAFVFVSVLWSLSVWAITPTELETEAERHITDLPEFQYIRQFAAARGIRAYLFGGSASSYIRYVKLDLDQKSKTKDLQKERFDYNFYRIFRSTQDVDIVLDGTPADAMALSNEVSMRFPYLAGDRSAWEVRLLREDMGDKEALLGNPSFSNQNTDSYSVGLVELTTPPEGESRVRDLKDWESPVCRFMKDVLSDQIHYYFSPLHHTTHRFQQGLNPPIFSVIRILIKMFQFSLTISDEDRKQMEQVISEFNPTSDLAVDYARRWILKNGINLLRHASDLELASNELSALRLKSVLSSLSQETQEGSLSWWLDREPLRSFPVGLGNGKTAQELGIKMLAHDTSNLAAIESIQRSPDGRPNQFATTYNGVEKVGVYTLVGNKGLYASGFTVRYVPVEGARLGTDFVLDGFNFLTGTSEIADGRVVIIKNKNAFRVVLPETGVNSDAYFRELFDKKFSYSAYKANQSSALSLLGFRGVGGGASSVDMALLQIYRQEAIRQLRSNPKASDAVNAFMREALSKAKDRFEPFVVDAVKEWLQFARLGPENTEIIESFIHDFYENQSKAPRQQHLLLFEALRSQSGDPATRLIIQDCFQSDLALEREFALLSMIGRKDPELLPIAEAGMRDRSPRVKQQAMLYFLARSEHLPSILPLIRQDSALLEDPRETPAYYSFPDLWDLFPRHSWYAMNREALRPFTPQSPRELAHLLLARGLSISIKLDARKALRETIDYLVVSHKASPLLFAAWLNHVPLHEENLNYALDYLSRLFSPGNEDNADGLGKLPRRPDISLRTLRATFVNTLLQISAGKDKYLILERMFASNNPSLSLVATEVLSLQNSPQFLEFAKKAAHSSNAEARRSAYQYIVANNFIANLPFLGDFFGDTDPKNQDFFRSMIKQLDNYYENHNEAIDQFLVNMAFSPSAHVASAAMRALQFRPKAGELFARLMTSESVDFLEFVVRQIVEFYREGALNPEFIQIGLEHPNTKIRAISYEGLEYFRGITTLLDRMLLPGFQDPERIVRLAASKVLKIKHPDWDQSELVKPEDTYDPRMDILVRKETISLPVEVDRWRALQAFVFAKNPKRRISAVPMLLARLPEEKSEHLIEVLLSDSEESVKKGVIKILRDFQWTAENAHPMLVIALLKEHKPEWHDLAIKIAKHGDPERMEPILQAATQDLSLRVRTKAWGAFNYCRQVLNKISI